MKIGKRETAEDICSGLWLAPPDGVPLPSAFRGLYGTKLGDERRIGTARIAPHVSLEPV